MTEALQKVEEAHVTNTYRQATEAASVCKSIVTTTALTIGGRKYVRVEGWQAIAVAHGCIASSCGVERITGGIKAIGEVRRMSDGQILSTAEGFVGDDEATWGKREEYAKRAMAQTRAISRACRSAFAHVVVMMDAGLETTPAEEIPQDGFAEKKKAPVVHQPSPEGGEIVKVEIGEIRSKSGASAKGPWTRWYFKAGDEYYSTFDSKLAESLHAVVGDTVDLRIERSDKGNNILGIVSDSQEELPM